MQHTVKHSGTQSDTYGVATTSRLLQIIGFVCRISSLLWGSFAKETYNFKEPTTCSHPIGNWRCIPVTRSPHVLQCVAVTPSTHLINACDAYVCCSAVTPSTHSINTLHQHTSSTHSINSCVACIWYRAWHTHAYTAVRGGMLWGVCQSIEKETIISPGFLYEGTLF